MKLFLGGSQVASIVLFLIVLLHEAASAAAVTQGKYQDRCMGKSKIFIFALYDI